MSKAFPKEEYPHQELTGRIIGAFFEVHQVLGYGLLESVYKRALAVELDFRGLKVTHEVPYPVVYRGVTVGTYRADQVVESAVIVESKTGIHLDPVSPAQTLRYLNASGLEVGLILHYGLRPTIKRMIRSRPHSIDTL